MQENSKAARLIPVSAALQHGKASFSPVSGVRTDWAEAQ